MAAQSKIRRVAVFGGSGFAGAAIVKALAEAGFAARVAVRSRLGAHMRHLTGGTDHIEQVQADVRDEASVARAMEGCDAAVNAVGLYVERGPETFHAVHERGAANLARQCAAQHVGRLIHLSGIGADLTSPSRYVRARAKGELAAQEIFPSTTILRPSVLFGPEDKFINTLAKMIRRAPVLPLFGQGLTKLQAVYVGDVARATLRAIEMPASAAKTFELGGPRAYTYRGLLELVAARIGKRPALLPIPFPVWDLLAGIASALPAPPLTRDQVTLMKSDNVVAESAPSLADLDVSATALEDILPEYGF